MRSLKTIALLIALLGAVPAQAQRIGTTYTYSGLTWSVSTNVVGMEYCNRLFLDATGDIYNSDHFATYGQLYCPALGGGYASAGSAYFDPADGFHMTVSLGITYKLVCDYLSGATLSGSCPVYNHLGAQVGTAFVSFL